MNHDPSFQLVLRPDERLVWSAAASPTLLAEARARSRRIAAAIVIGTGALSALFAQRFLEAAPHYGGADLLAGVLAPLYAIFALALGAAAIANLRRLSPPALPAMRFGLTNLRLIALGPDGAIADELPAAEADAVIAGGRARSPDIYVLRKDDPGDDRAFALEYLDRPFDAKAIIEETLLPDAEPTP